MAVTEPHPLPSRSELEEVVARAMVSQAFGTTGMKAGAVLDAVLAAVLPPNHVLVRYEAVRETEGTGGEAWITPITFTALHGGEIVADTVSDVLAFELFHEADAGDLLPEGINEFALQVKERFRDRADAVFAAERERVRTELDFSSIEEGTEEDDDAGPEGSAGQD